MTKFHIVEYYRLNVLGHKRGGGIKHHNLSGGIWINEMPLYVSLIMHICFSRG